MANEITNYVNGAIGSLSQFNLNNIQKPITLTREEDLLNLNTPLTFIQWIGQHTSINTGDEYKEYNNYLKLWYSNKASKKEDQIFQIRNDYVNFLRELSLVFKDDPQFKYISEINFDDNLDIEYAIPYFTKKIKEICFYIINKRESAKTAKLKYNMAGSNQAVEKLFYQYLLQAFTKRNTVVQVPEFSNTTLLPELSSVSASFKVYIEELNDNGSYFDKDPSIATVETPAISSYFNLYGLEMSNYDWIFNSGTMPLCSDNPFFWTLQQTLDLYGVDNVSMLPFSSVDLSDQLSPNTIQNIQSDISEKYIGSNYYLLSGGYYILDKQMIELNLIPGNNWFYWPTGEKISDVSNMQVFDDIKINDTSLLESGAKSSDDYREADKIFVEKDDSISGAWLRYYLRQLETQTMSCLLGGDQTLEFKFPYCDYGFVGDGTQWTGRGISNLDSGYTPLDDENKKKVNELYWEYTTSNSQICAINLNETTLIENGAHSSVMYLSADKISKRLATNVNKVNDSTVDGVYNDGYEYSWLYKFLKTDIPVKVGKSTIQWPVQRVENPDEKLLNISSDFCSPISLSSVEITKFLGSRAGYALNDSDIIYKLNTKNGYPVECAYLKGYPIAQSFPSDTVVTGDQDITYTSTVTGTMQIGLTLKCKPDSPETFLWQGANTPISSLKLNYKQHQDDCPFIHTVDHISLYKQKDVGEFEFKYPWNVCECKAVLYSPIGHTGENFDDFSGMADVIVMDTQDPNPFNLQTWAGSDGEDYKNSSDFAWYKINKTETSNEQGLDVDVGMGIGEWRTGSGIPFVFKSGKQYKYIRNGLKRTYNELVTDVVPPIVISELYTHTKMPAWRKATLNSNGEWEETTLRTDMVLNPGDYIYMDHYQSNFYCLKYNGTFGEFTINTYPVSTSNSTNDFWVNHTFATTGINIKFLWPSTIHNGYSNVPYTSSISNELSAVNWNVLIGASSYNALLSPEEELVINSQTPDIINVSVSGYKLNGQIERLTMTPVEIVAPQLTTTVKTSGEHFIQTVYSDTINYILNIPLYGWNYNTNTFDGVSVGAKPFWGQASDANNYTTKGKGVREWGYGLRTADEYTIIHQPPVSFITLNIDDTVKYEKKNNAITWVQPIEFIVNDETEEWCNLIINSEKDSNLSAYLHNQTKELVVYPTTEKAEFTLNQYDFINYWSSGEFTWYQELTNSSAGIPPFGGTFVPYTSSLVIESLVPYANITNQHYPSIAVYPNALNFYSDRDSGGYLNYKGLGILTYLGKNHFNTINPLLTSNTDEKNNLLFRDPDVFVSNDIGFTKKTQQGPIVNISNDSSWMKGRITEGNLAGSIVVGSDYKEFTPYQTKEETTGKNSNGLINIDYNLDPWYGEFDNNWRDTINWPPNFRQQYPVQQWDENQNIFLKKQSKHWQSNNITLNDPYIRDGVESRNAPTKEYNNMAALGASVQTNANAFLSAIVIHKDSISDEQDIGGVILQVNSSYYKNYYIPMLSAQSVSLSSVGFNVIYGEPKTSAVVSNYGYLEMNVNNDVYYIPVYKTNKTTYDTTNLTGALNINKEFNPSLNSYLLVYVNEVEKRLIPLYK